jgi:hypothetical protein
MEFKKKRPDCSKCAPNGYPIILDENIETLQFIDRNINFFYDGMNGMKLDCIFLALNHENKIHLLEKVKIYTLAAIAERTREREPVKTFKTKRRN